MLQFYLSLLETEEDRANISRIYEQYLDWMIKIAYHYLRDEKDAEDAVSDVFLNIVSTNSSIPVNLEEETKAYLFICIRNSVSRIQRLKSKNKSVNFEELFSLSSNMNVEDDVIQKDSYEALLRFINTMPSIYKDVLTLYIAFNRTTVEIAKILKIPYKTAETRLQRGKAILKERLGDMEI